uniref:G-patch domain-containing protein n=1 Tax=Dunaliella tertiolecta TaxID=3047 RepID=A0A7S3QRJ1_DUNTE
MGQDVREEDGDQEHHQYPRQHEAGPRQQERDSQHVGHESQAAPEQRRADVEVERCWLGQGVRTHQWYQQQRHQQQTGPSARGLKQDDGTRGADRAPISIARAPLSVRALKQQQQQQHVVELPPPPPLPVPTSLSPSPLAPSQHLPPPPPLPLPPSLQAPLPPHLQPALPLPTPLQPALPFAPELLPPHLRQACYFFTPNYLHLPPPPAGKKPLSKNGRKAARKKANKRARAQGLAPPGSGSAPTKKRSSKDADEARAAAEAAQNKFAGFEDHTSGIGSRLLAKMGWRSGEGLGQKAQGRSEPVIPQLIKGKRGLGA